MPQTEYIYVSNLRAFLKENFSMQLSLFYGASHE